MTALEHNIERGKFRASSLPIALRLIRRGRAVDYCEAVLVGPIARRSLARAMQALAPDCIQLVPAEIPDHDDWEGVNVVCTDGRVDRDRSILNLDSADNIKYIEELCLALPPPNAHIFRLHEYREAIVISSEMRQCMLDAGCEGAAFLPIPGPTVGPSMD